MSPFNALHSLAMSTMSGLCRFSSNSQKNSKTLQEAKPCKKIWLKFDIIPLFLGIVWRPQSPAPTLQPQPRLVHPAVSKMAEDGEIYSEWSVFS